jgi:TatD DNase family protein
MRLVDLHCHLDLFPDPEKAIAEAEVAGVYTLTVTTTPRAWPRNRAMTESTRCVRAALGLHPQLVAEHSDELGLWEKYLPEATYVGEVGLDAGPRYFRSFDLQKQVFEQILKLCAKAGGKVLSVHSVRSVKPVLDLVEATLPPARGKVVLHWFTGTKAEARRAAEMGCYFSVNAAMLANEKGRDIAAMIPLDRLLTETDGPFTSAGVVRRARVMWPPCWIRSQSCDQRRATIWRTPCCRISARSWIRRVIRSVLRAAKVSIVIETPFRGRR